MRTLGIVTVGRSDYGIYLPILRRLRETPGLATWLFVSGAHLDERFGFTVRQIEADGFPIRERVPLNLQGDSPAAVAEAMGCGVAGFAQALARSRPDLLLVLGDRFDMIPAALAALPLRIPVAHIHGGEVTEGAMDESIRHAITKLSHLHFVSTSGHAARVRQLGEAPWRITVSGAPALDAVQMDALLSDDVLSRQIGLDVRQPLLLLTYHPATLAEMPPAEQIAEVLAGISSWQGGVLITGVNADTGHAAVRAALQAYVADHPMARMVESLGPAYFSVLARAAVMVGNSSSGLIEAPSFALPVVNIGARQQGRLRGVNVLDVACRRDAIAAALIRATAPAFRAGLRGIRNPYGDGHAAARIVERLATVPLDETLLVKKFFDLPQTLEAVT